MLHTIVLVKLFSNRYVITYVAARTTLYLLFTSSTDVHRATCHKNVWLFIRLEKWMVYQLISQLTTSSEKTQGNKRVLYIQWLEYTLLVST